MPELTDSDLAAIRARVNKSQPGPWYTGTDEDGHMIYDEDSDPVADTLREDGDAMAEVDNAEFIAHARTDVPRLLAHIDALRATVADRDAVIERLRDASNYPLQLAKVERDKAVELLRRVHEQAGNAAPEHRRHALTPGLRDEIADVVGKEVPE